MYSSPHQRNADIEAGAHRPASDLRAWVEQSATRLAEAFAGLDAEQWERPVRTAQGRTVPASEIPWLRAREVMVHRRPRRPSRLFRSAGGLFAGPG